MKKNIILALTVVAMLFVTGCGKKEIEDKEKVVMTSGEVSSGIVIGKELSAFTFKDQFEKEHSLTKDIKKVVFAFSNTTGQLMKMYVSLQPKDYLSSRDILYIADISGMPSVISKMFAIPAMKDDGFPILLIKEKENAIRFRNEDQKGAVMIISLENKIIQSVKFVTNEVDLKTEID
ncbi:MAG: hypothetical protein DRG78_10705 [Epsilonproteobacteria bacterium]|nr:MAG: hypothetical protein DRG78_10705 [Campylobacterota bacterium]